MSHEWDITGSGTRFGHEYDVTEAIGLEASSDRVFETSSPLNLRIDQWIQFLGSILWWRTEVEVRSFDLTDVCDVLDTASSDRPIRMEIQPNPNVFLPTFDPEEERRDRRVDPRLRWVNSIV